MTMAKLTDAERSIRDTIDFKGQVLTKLISMLESIEANTENNGLVAKQVFSGSVAGKLKMKQTMKGLILINNDTTRANSFDVTVGDITITILGDHYPTIMFDPFTEITISNITSTSYQIIALG